MENRSARAASRGRYSQKRTPGRRVCVVPYSPRMPSGASGLGSNVSCCDGPPDWKMKTTDRAFRRGRRGDGLGFQPQQVGEAHAEQAQAAGLEQLAAGDPGMIFLAAAGLNHGSILASHPFTAASTSRLRDGSGHPRRDRSTT